MKGFVNKKRSKKKNSQHHIIFRLSDTEKIVIELKEAFCCVHCHIASFVFVRGIRRYLLCNDTLHYGLKCFVNIFNEAWFGRLGLDQSLAVCESSKHDMGYVFNQIRQRLSSLYEHGGNNWRGHKYKLWGEEAVGWVYNDDAGNIIFKLTPVFSGPAYSIDSDEHQQQSQTLQYDQWLKNYKPIFETEIHSLVAQEWLIKTCYLLYAPAKDSRTMLTNGVFKHPPVSMK